MLNCLTDDKKRDSRFELLRIIIMFGIVIGHYMCHGGVLMYGSNINRFVASGISIWGGKTSNDIFIMISSWFLIDKRKHNVIDKSIKDLVMRTAFFSFVLCVISNIVAGTLGIETIFSVFEWIIYGHGYGFIVEYILLVALYPLLNIAIENMSEILLGRMCFWGYVSLMVFRRAYNIPTVFTFILIYFAVAYIKKYKLCLIRQHWCVIIFFAGSIFVKLCQSVSQLLGSDNLVYLIDEECDIFVLINALSVFLFCVKMKPFYNRIVNLMAKDIIVVYLLHENIYLRSYIWDFLGVIYFIIPILCWFIVFYALVLL